MHISFLCRPSTANRESGVLTKPHNNSSSHQPASQPGIGSYRAEVRVGRKTGCDNVLLANYHRARSFHVLDGLHIGFCED